MQHSREARKEANPLKIHLHGGEARRDPMEVRAWALSSKENFLLLKLSFLDKNLSETVSSKQ